MMRRRKVWKAPVTFASILSVSAVICFIMRHVEGAVMLGCVLLIVGLGLNLMGITRIKVADYLPAIVIAPILCWIISAVPALSAFFG